VIWLISLMYFFTKMGRYAIFFWLPLYMVEHLGYSLAEAGYTSILYEAGGFIGIVAAGYVSDKLFQARRMPVGALGMWGLAITCLFQPQLAGWSHLGNAIGISLIGFSCRHHKRRRLAGANDLRFYRRLHSDQIRLGQPVLLLCGDCCYRRLPACDQMELGP